MNYYKKYLKYKKKYLDLKEQILLSGGNIDRKSYLSKALSDTKNHCEPGENFALTSPKKHGKKYRLAFFKSQTSGDHFKGKSCYKKRRL